MPETSSEVSSANSAKVAASVTHAEAAALPDRCVRIASSVASVTTIVADKRADWTNYLSEDIAKQDKPTAELIKALLKLYPE